MTWKTNPAKLQSVKPNAQSGGKPSKDETAKMSNEDKRRKQKHRKVT